MVKQNAVARVHAIRLAIVDRNPKSIEFCASIRRTGVERGCLTLRGLHNFAVKLRSGSLIEPDVLLETTGSDGIKETEGAQTIDIAGVFSHLEGYFDV